MLAKYILSALACAFLLAAIWGLATDRPGSQTRTWLLIAGIFGAVGVWLFLRG